MLRGRLVIGILVGACVAGLATAGLVRRVPGPMRFKSPTVEVVAPDYRKWGEVRAGMTEAEVVRVLGSPIVVDFVPDDYGWDPACVKTIAYGHIRFGGALVPGEYRYYIDFQMDKVIRKVDPFGGRLSPDGRPTTPVMISPPPATEFEHYPRYLDLRWHPSSGAYPITYTVQIASGRRADERLGAPSERQWCDAYELLVDYPYAAVKLANRGRGRWRVRAANRLGTSEWSAWSPFEFSR